MANHSSILAWEIPWTEEPGGLQSMGGGVGAGGGGGGGGWVTKSCTGLRNQTTTKAKRYF